jgi:hypothetical protein
MGYFSRFQLWKFFKARTEAFSDVQHHNLCAMAEKIDSTT